MNAARMKHTTSDAASWLVADIGATSSRCATLTPPADTPENIRHYRNDNYAGLTDLLADYLGARDEKPRSLGLAVAAPVYGDDIRMINRDWSFSGTSLSSDLNFAHVTIINDFHAIAYALPALDDDARCEVGSATEYRGGNMAAIGPGSGLGTSAWIGGDAGGAAMTGEGGHVTVSGRNQHEDEIIARVRDRFGHCSAERILSGPGLITLHHAMHGIEIESPEAITGNPGDDACAATLNQFFSFLGSAAADLALITGAFGGLYIAGGIVPACIEQLRQSPFRERFDDKNRYQDYMRRIPTYVITDPLPGLTGLVAMINRGS
ncbi:MAG: glucokinase [Gammaproteobacteria bacterium]|nr:MAG: glucokinase [Gammaproteobacteria bacterium]